MAMQREASLALSGQVADPNHPEGCRVIDVTRAPPAAPTDPAWAKPRCQEECPSESLESASARAQRAHKGAARSGLSGSVPVMAPGARRKFQPQ